MTDTSNRYHRNTLPIGGMRPAIWQTYVELAKESMCAPVAELVARTTQPFVTAISDATCPRAVALGGKVLIVGEALNLMRPPMALSTTQSAVHALTLERTLRQSNAGDFQKWERDVLQYNRLSALKTNAFGTFFLYGYVVAAGWALRLCTVLLCEMWPPSLLWNLGSERKDHVKKDKEEVGMTTEKS